MEQYREQVTKEIIDSGSFKGKGKKGKLITPVNNTPNTGKPRGQGNRNRSRSSKDRLADDINMT